MISSSEKLALADLMHTCIADIQRDAELLRLGGHLAMADRLAGEVERTRQRMERANRLLRATADEFDPAASLRSLIADVERATGFTVDAPAPGEATA